MKKKKQKKISRLIEEQAYRGQWINGENGGEGKTVGQQQADAPQHKERKLQVNGENGVPAGTIKLSSGNGKDREVAVGS